MGVSISSAAITSFAAGSFFYLGKLVPFQKFAVIITSTIGISYLASMIVFGALMHEFGPVRGCGDIWYACSDNSDKNEGDFAFE